VVSRLTVGNRQGDLQARRQFGWRPTVAFEELVRLMVDADIAALAARKAGVLTVGNRRGGFQAAAELWPGLAGTEVPCGLKPALRAVKNSAGHHTSGMAVEPP